MQLSCDSGGQLQTFDREIQTGKEPVFYTLNAIIPENVRHISIVMAVPTGSEVTQNDIFFDGLVLVKGNKISKVPPVFEDASGRRGQWDGLTFINIVRNPSAEQAGPGFKPWTNKILMKVMPPFPASFPSDIPSSLLDWKGAGWYYQYTTAIMLRTFWAKFGWGNVPLLGSKPYRVLIVATLLGVMGALWAIWQRRRALPWDVLLILGLAFLGVWIQVIVRGLGSIFGSTFIPSSRYGTPAILPTILILCTGWLEILRILGRWLRMGAKVKITVYLLCFFMLDIFSIDRKSVV
jgi:hypothetical protein